MGVFSTPAATFAEGVDERTPLPARRSVPPQIPSRLPQGEAWSRTGGFLRQGLGRSDGVSPVRSGPPAPGRAAPACARRPSDTLRGSRPAAPPGGTGSPPRSGWRRRPGPPPGRLSARRSPGRSRIGRGPPGGIARRACQTRCWKAVPPMSRGRAAPRPGASTRPTTCAPPPRSRGRPGQRRLGEAVLEVAHQGVGIVAEQDRADAGPRRRHQDVAERAGADREADRRALPAAPVGRRRHAEAGRRRGVEPARRAVAGLIDRLRDRAGLPQPPPPAPLGAPPHRPAASPR